MRATFSVIPGQDQRDEEPDAQRDNDEAHRLLGPVESLRDDVDPLEERERRRDIGQCPLHQFALLQALQEFVHCAAFFSSTASFANKALKRGSSRSESHVGESFRTPYWTPQGMPAESSSSSSARSFSPTQA